MPCKQPLATLALRLGAMMKAESVPCVCPNAFCPKMAAAKHDSGVVLRRWVARRVRIQRDVVNYKPVCAQPTLARSDHLNWKHT
eukprot:15376343-Alexandrium_andersonii.AAC.1